MKPISSVIQDGIVDFDAYFGEDSLMKDIYYDAKKHYIATSNFIPVQNYKFEAAELILGDIYQSKFGRGDNDSIYEINNKGINYFTDKLAKSFEADDTSADIKLNVSTSDNPIYIRYVAELPGIDKTVNLKVESFTGDEGITQYKYVRYNQKGEAMYTLPDINNVRVINEDGKEIILIKAVTITKIVSAPETAP